MTINEAKEILQYVGEMHSIPEEDMALALAMAFTVPDNIREHLRKVTLYLHEEEKHWIESNKPVKHIYKSVRAIEQYLERNSHADI